MARVHGIQAGLRPAVYEPPSSLSPEKSARAGKRVEVDYSSLPENCDICHGKLGWNHKAARAMSAIVAKMGFPLCEHCARFFGYQGIEGFYVRGTTSDSHEEAAKKIAAIVDTGYAMILKPGTFGDKSGRTISIDMGDIFKIERAGGDTYENMNCSIDRTKTMFTVHISVGKTGLTLYTHEVAAIGWARIMELRSAGELTEEYVEAGDDHGYFAPTPEMRRQIEALFGDFWNRRRRPR